MAYRIIFLDFDGVLHPFSECDVTFGVDGNGRLRAIGNGLFRWADTLADLLEGCEDVLLVVHSSWREHMSIQELRINVPERLAKRMVDVTRPGDKYESIQEYVREYGSEICDYRIIDDDEYCFP